MRKLNMFRSFIMAASLAFGAFSFTSCDNNTDGPAGSFAEDGVFVINEGNYGSSNGSVSFYNSSTQQVENGIFGKSNNGQILGDVLQSMFILNEKAYLVANNSNKIEVVNANTFKSAGTITGLESPRYFTALNGSKGYVTEWLAYDPVTYAFSNGRVAVVDLKTNTVTGTIEVGVQPEQLVISGGKLYVANSGGNTVSVINTATDQVENTITVTAGPSNLAPDASNNLWVLSNGVKYTSDNTAGALSKINLSSGAVTAAFPFPDKETMASSLVLNGSKNRLYYSYGGKVYAQDISATTRNTSPIIEESFYGLGVDPETGNIYGGDSNNFVGDGTVFIYQPDGRKIGEFQVGIAPNSFVFR